MFEDSGQKNCAESSGNLTEWLTVFASKDGIWRFDAWMVVLAKVHAFFGSCPRLVITSAISRMG